MSWVAVATIGGAVIGGAVSYNSAEEAEDAQYAASQQARADSQAAQNQARDDYRPWRETGERALARLEGAEGVDPYSQYRGRTFLSDADITGIESERAPAQANPFAGRGGIFGRMGNALAQQTDPNWRPGAGNAEYQAYLKDPEGYRRLRGQVGSTPAQQGGQGRYGAFYASPGYEFARDEALRGTRYGMGARGSMRGGRALTALQDRSAGLASQEFGNWYNRNLSLAGLGQTANSQYNALNANYTANQNAGTIQQGDNRASGYLGQGYAIGNALNNAGRGFANARSPYGGGGYSNPGGGYADYVGMDDDF